MSIEMNVYDFLIISFFKRKLFGLLKGVTASTVSYIRASKLTDDY